MTDDDRLSPYPGVASLEGVTPKEIALIRAEHIGYHRQGTFCRRCWNALPCPTLRLVTAYEAANRRQGGKE